jgi:hypothetical protein
MHVHSATFVKELQHQPSVARAFSAFFSTPGRYGARGCTVARLVRRSGGIRSLSGWVVSNQSAASGSIRATWAGRENRTFLSFPVRVRVWKTCVSPVDDASLLIDGDAFKTFKTARRNRRKKFIGNPEGWGDCWRRTIAPSHMRTIARLRQKERVSRSSASSHTSR